MMPDEHVFQEICLRCGGRMMVRRHYRQDGTILTLGFCRDCGWEVEG